MYFQKSGPAILGGCRILVWMWDNFEKLNYGNSKTGCFDLETQAYLLKSSKLSNLDEGEGTNRGVLCQQATLCHCITALLNLCAMMLQMLCVKIAGQKSIGNLFI